VKPPGIAALLLAAAFALGCGKADLAVKPHHSSSRSASLTEPGKSIKKKTTKQEPAPSPTQAKAFARAVLLQPLDVTGAHVQKQEREGKSGEEARECAPSAGRAIGGLESERYVRGSHLAREVISSGVAVLASHTAAVKDILAVTSSAGIACYARIVRKHLGSGENALELRGLSVTRLQVPVRGPVHGLGIRVAAGVTSAKVRVSIPIYIDALVFVYKQAEVELYASSYVQPVPRRTEEEMLEVMYARALLAKL
jgi:hypothetical protein